MHFRLYVSLQLNFFDMTWWLLIIPFISAFIGWMINGIIIKMLFYPEKPGRIAGFAIQGFFPKRQQEFAEKLGRFVSEEMLSPEEIKQKINDPSHLKKFLSVVETHVDDFLHRKLNDAFPILSKFLGDKTRSQLKSYFMIELDSLFPALIGNYAGNLLTDIDIRKIVVDKVATYPMDKLESIFRQSLAKELRFIRITGAISGFLIGVIQVALAFLLRK